MTRRGRIGGMRRIGRQVHKKWRAILRTVLNEIQRLAHIHIRAVIFRLSAIGNLLPILVQCVIVFTVRIPFHRDIPFIPAGWNIQWVVLVGIAVEVFTGQQGVITCRLKPDGNGGFFLAEAKEFLPAAIGRIIAENLGVVRVLPAQRGRTRRTTERLRDKIVGERFALIRDQRF